MRLDQLSERALIDRNQIVGRETDGADAPQAGARCLGRSRTTRANILAFGTPEEKEALREQDRRGNKKSYARRRARMATDPEYREMCLAKKRQKQARYDAKYPRARQERKLRQKLREKLRQKRYLDNPPLPSSLELTFRDATFRAVWDAAEVIRNLSWREDIVSEAIIALLSGEADTPESAVSMGRKRAWRPIRGVSVSEHPFMLDVISFREAVN